MKKYFFIFCFVIFSVAARPQSFNTDSVMHIVETYTNDSARLDAFYQFYGTYSSGNLDSLILYSKKAIAFGQSHHIPRLEAAGYDGLGYAFSRMGNLAQQQVYVLKAAEILDKYPENQVQSHVAISFSFFQPTDSLSAVYLGKAMEFAAQAGRNSKALLKLIYGNLSFIYMTANRLDSALFYAQKSYDLAISDSGNKRLEPTTVWLSLIHSRLHQFDLAAAYGKMALAEAQKYPEAEMLDIAYWAMATYFDSTHRQDSAFYYYSKLYHRLDIGFYPLKIKAANQLYLFYKQRNQTDSALKYAGIYIAGNDSLNNIQNKRQIEKINLQENLRQQELVAQQTKEKETQKHNLQFAVIAIGILVAVMLFLLMSRSFMVSHKTIEALSIIMLLIVFEFINLLLHDYLAEITNNSPFLMLLALVIIAALIVPLHHRLEKWATEILVEKNKQVRLAKAKKIVSELESK